LFLQAGTKILRCTAGVKNVTFLFSLTNIYKKDIASFGNIEKYSPTELRTFLKTLNPKYKKNS
jgi:hypothetical protein